ncbi:MAG: thioredoxin [Nitrososphaeria archaeon]|nr:thioredoxin [Conexivisphaerales archaeon]
MTSVDDEEMIKQKILKQLISQKTNVQSYDEPVVLTDDTFNEFISKNENVVVDCWAEWCYPCRVVSPIVDELAKKYKGKIAFAKLNVDENQLTAMQYGIMSIPTLLIFKNGQLVDQIVGALPKKLIEVNILRALGV